MPRHASLDPRLPPDLAALAADPHFALHDGRFHEVTVDTAAQTVIMAIDCGDLQVGYRRLSLWFKEATVVPDDLQRLAEAVGAEFRANHWHQRRTVTEIRGQEVHLLPDGAVRPSTRALAVLPFRDRVLGVLSRRGSDVRPWASESGPLHHRRVVMAVP